MKKLMIGAVLAGQGLTAAQPAFAAEPDAASLQRPGAFAGVRLRVPLDGDPRRRELRAGLTLAPTLHSRNPRGESRTRIGEGVELGLAGGEPLRLSIGGTPVSRLAQGPAGPQGQRAGVSTLGWVAIGVGATAVTLFALYGLCFSGEICDMDED